MDFRQSKQFAAYLEASGWKIKRLSDGTFVYIFQLPLLGSFIRISRSALPILFEEVDMLAKKYNAVLVKLEPEALETSDKKKKISNSLNKNGHRQDRWSIEPTKTLIINLAQSKEKIWSNLRKTWRKDVQIARTAKVIVKQSQDIDEFIALWQKNAKKKGFAIEKEKSLLILWKEFKKVHKAWILLVQMHGKSLGGVLLLGYGNKISLWHIAYSGEEKEKQPMQLLVWESIVFAKRKGFHIFDFEGISDNRYSFSKNLQSDYFKKGFGGEEIEYIGSFVKYYKVVQSIPFRLLGIFKPDLFRFIYKKFYG